MGKIYLLKIKLVLLMSLHKTLSVLFAFIIFIVIISIDLRNISRLGMTSGSGSFEGAVLNSGPQMIPQRK